MTAYRHPDPAIESWLSDGPNVLSSPAREAVSKAIRETRQRRPIILWLPDLNTRRLLLVVGVALATVLTVALAGGARLLVPDPASTSAPTASAPIGQPSVKPTADPAAGTVTIDRPWVALSFEYRIPAGLELARGRQDGRPNAGFAFFTDGAGRPYGPGDRGVVVEEVSNAKAHYSNGVLLGNDAASFMAGMAAHDAFRIGEVFPAMLDGRPALGATATAGHFDIDLGPNSVYLDPASRIIVADIDGATVMVQIWASSMEELEAWLPEALAFADSFHFRVERATGG